MKKIILAALLLTFTIAAKAQTAVNGTPVYNPTTHKLVCSGTATGMCILFEEDHYIHFTWQGHDYCAHYQDVQVEMDENNHPVLYAFGLEDVNEMEAGLGQNPALCHEQ